MRLSEISDLLDLFEVSVSDETKEVSGGFCGDLLSFVMSKAERGNAWITVMTGINVIAVAVARDIACVILSDGVKADDEMINAAKTHGVNLFSSPKSKFELVAALWACFNA